MSEKQYLVKVRNDVLGNSDHIMTKGQIKKFNHCADRLRANVDVAGGVHVSGMWSVEAYIPTEKGSSI